MNLREIRSNHDLLNAQFASMDCSDNALQEVLGVLWHTPSTFQGTLSLRSVEAHTLEGQLLLKYQYRSLAAVLTKRSIPESTLLQYTTRWGAYTSNIMRKAVLTTTVGP
ncbi:hypothetical protein RB195_019067 [Necator americanus]|uniref:Uncharacterized protein n=1 Tax=Necator americanus TaxID=51031 RepID=A0ABR1CCG7_NECAM